MEWAEEMSQEFQKEEIQDDRSSLIRAQTAAPKKGFVFGEGPNHSRRWEDEAEDELGMDRRHFEPRFWGMRGE